MNITWSPDSAHIIEVLIIPIPICPIWWCPQWVKFLFELEAVDFLYILTLSPHWHLDEAGAQKLS